jgi:hypothetical protein
MKQRVKDKGTETEESPGYDGGADIGSQDKDDQNDEYVVDARQGREPQNHSQGKAKGDLPRVRIGMHDSYEFKDVPNHVIGLLMAGCMVLEKCEEWLTLN